MTAHYKKNFAISFAFRSLISTFGFAESTFAREYKMKKLCLFFCFPLTYSYLCTEKRKAESQRVLSKRNGIEKIHK